MSVNDTVNCLLINPGSIVNVIFLSFFCIIKFKVTTERDSEANVIYHNIK